MPEQRPRILIIGAGYVGLEAARRFQDAGYEAVLARRSALAQPGFRSLVCDVTDREGVRALPEAQAILYAVSAGESSEQAYEQAYSIGVKNVVDACLAQRERPRFYLVSSTSVYAEAAGGEVDETSTDLVRQGASRFIVLGEDLLLRSGLDGAILRCGGIYGPGRTSFLQRVQDGLERLKPAQPSYTNRIHRDEIGAIALFLERKRSPGMQIVNAVDKISSSRDEVIQWLAQELGVKAPLEDGTAAARERGAGKRVNSGKLQEMGYSYLYPSFREGYAPLLNSLELERRPRR